MLKEQASGVRERTFEAVKDIIPKTASTKGQVCYIIMEPIPGTTSRIMGIESFDQLPGLEAVLTHGKKYLYVVAIPGDVVRKLKYKDVATNFEFDPLRHAVIPPTADMMEAIREGLARYRGNVLWVTCIFPLVKRLIEEETVKGKWLAIE